MRKGLTTKKTELKIKQNIPISCYCHGHPKKKHVTYVDISRYDREEKRGGERKKGQSRT